MTDLAWMPLAERRAEALRLLAEFRREIDAFIRAGRLRPEQACGLPEYMVILCLTHAAGGRPVQRKVARRGGRVSG